MYCVSILYIYSILYIIYIDTNTVCVSMVYIYTCENKKSSNTYSPRLPANGTQRWLNQPTADMASSENRVPHSVHRFIIISPKIIGDTSF